MLMLFILYLIVVNLVTYYLYWRDKRASVRKDWRVPESVLLCAGFMGGTPAAFLAQHRLRHKTKKGTFQARFWLLTVIQMGGLVFLPAPVLYIL